VNFLHSRAKAPAPAGVWRWAIGANSAVGKIEAGDDILDPDRSGSGKQNFVLIGDTGRRALLPQPE
jgi:hypothetical protein